MNIRCIIDLRFIFCFIFLVALSATAITQEDNSSFWLQKGDEFYKNNSYDLALRCYNKAIEIDPENAYAWNSKGNILKKLNRTDEANSAFVKAKDPGDINSAEPKNIDEDIPKRDNPLVNPSVEYIETDFQEKGNGYVVFLTLYDKNDHFVISDGTLTIDYYSDKAHNEFVRSETFDVTTDGFGEYFLKIAPSVKSTLWKSERILDSRFPKCSEDDVPCGSYYANCIFTDPNGDKFQYDSFLWL
jgi:tetratricopeptide (TPR) repeat protein